MKKTFILFLLMVFSITLNAQKKVALLETLNGDKSVAVKGIEMNMVRGELRKAITNQAGYQAFTRTDIDQLMKEHNFQSSGMVTDSQRKRVGEMSGADYICVSTLTKSNYEFYLEAYLIDIESGEISNPSSQYGMLKDGTYANLYQICQDLAQELIGYVDNYGGFSSEKYYSQGQDFTETAFGLNMRMIYVEGGTFNMGCTREQGNDCDGDENNVRQVTVDGFYIGMLEVSQAQWCKVFGLSEGDLMDEYSGDSYEKIKAQSIYYIVGDADYGEEAEEALTYGYKIGDTIFAPMWGGGRMTRFGSNYPVYAINYFAATEFCRLLSERTGKNYTLPTEAQWEYAARGGKMSRGKKYAGSNTIEDVGWYSGNSENHVQAGGTRSPNELGIYDMCGNVSELCLDCYHEPYLNYDIINPGRNPEEDYCSRVIRGGDFTEDATKCRVSARNALWEEIIYPYNVGFRVVYNLDNNAKGNEKKQ